MNRPQIQADHRGSFPSAAILNLREDPRSSAVQSASLDRGGQSEGGSPNHGVKMRP